MINLPFFIAKRYFLSKKEKGYVHLVSLISQFGIAVGTAALILVLSVFNGFEDLVLSMYNVFDPHLKVTTWVDVQGGSEKVRSLLEVHIDSMI
jgi:lipoprotein-releasing system permease protein